MPSLGQRIDDSIANADAQVNNWDLPTYTNLIDVLRYLTQQVSLTDDGRNLHAISKANEVLLKYRAVINAAN